MTTVPVIASGPIGFETIGGTYFTVPLNVLSYDGSQIQITGWTPPAGTAAQDVKDWATYLFNQGEIVPAPVTATPPAGPAFLAEAVYAGLSGKTLSIDISNVTKLNPPSVSTMTLKVDYTEVYSGLQTDTLDAVLGHVANGGTTPGLLFLDTGTPVAMPKDSTDNPVTAGSVTLPATAGDAFKLNDVPNSDVTAPDTFTVTVATTSATKFDMTIHWVKTLADKKLEEHADAFKAVVTISPPPIGGYGVPAAGTVPLNNGSDGGTTPPLPAQATVPSA